MLFLELLYALPSRRWEREKRFFQAIVDGYPDSGSAKVAKRHL